MTETGLLVCQSYVLHPFTTSAHCVSLYVACPGWQTAPGGVGLTSRPPSFLLKFAQAWADGQSGVPGYALHLLDSGPVADARPSRPGNDRRSWAGTRMMISPVYALVDACMTITAT